MSGAEAKWDRIYAARGQSTSDGANEALLAVSDLLPNRGRALDLAGGAGRNAMWLAQRGLEVTMLDVSSEALKLAGTMARERGLHLNLSKVDLEQNTPPAGPWDLIIVVNYCQRDLYRTIAKTLTPGGVIAVVQATTKNLERHKSPSARFLIEHREIEMLFDDLTTLHNKADWMKNGRHEVTLVVQRDSVTV